MFFSALWIDLFLKTVHTIVSITGWRVQMSEVRRRRWEAAEMRCREEAAGNVRERLKAEVWEGRGGGRVWGGEGGGGVWDGRGEGGRRRRWPVEMRGGGGERGEMSEGGWRRKAKMSGGERRRWAAAEMWERGWRRRRRLKRRSWRRERLQRVK